MDRLRRILVAVAALVCLAVPGWADEEPDGDFEDFDQLYLGGLLDKVVSAAKHEQDVGESASAISVITREQIENTACTDVVCLLRQVPEVDVLRVKPIFAAVGARALTEVLGDKVLLMVDGQEINNDFYGFPVWQALPVHLEDIERIEVIRGPGSALYGANAHSMVVSISTRRQIDHTAEVFIGSGEHGRSSVHLRLGQPLGGWNLQLQGGLDTADHWRITGVRGREVSRTMLAAHRKAGNSSTLVQLGLVGIEGSAYADLAPLIINNGWIGHFNASHEHDWLKTRLTGNFTQADYTLDMDLIYQGSKLGTAPRDVPALIASLDSEVQVTWPLFEDNLFIAGISYRWITLRAETNHPDVVNQHRAGLFVQDEQRLWERLLLTLSARVDFNTITPPAFSPRAAGVVKLSEDQHVRLAFGMAFRKPSLFNTSLHIEGFQGETGFEILEEFFRDNIGNRDLENEEITTLEAGYNGRFLDRRLSTEAVTFYNRYRNRINNVVNIVLRSGLPDLAQSSIHYDNLGQDVDSLGGTLSVTYRVSGSVRANLSYTYRHSWYTSDPYDLTVDSSEEEKIKGERVTSEPAHLLKASLHYLSPQGLSLGGSFFARSSFRWPLTEHGGPLDAYVAFPNPAAAFMNAFMAWRWTDSWGFVELGLRIFDILNHSFRDVPATYRQDGVEMGGEMLGRRVFVFLRGSR